MSFETISFDHLPHSIEEFIALRDTLAVTPEGGAVMLALALLRYAQAPDLPEGRHCLAIAVDRSRLVESPDGYQGWTVARADFDLIRRQLAGREYVARSYFQGTSPATGYALPAPPYACVVSDNPHSGDRDAGRYKVFVASSGAATPRPVTLLRNQRGYWKAVEWSSLLTGVQPPATPVDDEL